MISELLRLIVIYKNPLDYPDKFVARGQRTMNNGSIELAKNIFAIGSTLEEIREKIPKHLVCIQRHQSDDPCIVETWV